MRTHKDYSVEELKAELAEANMLLEKLRLKTNYNYCLSLIGNLEKEIAARQQPTQPMTSDERNK